MPSSYTPRLRLELQAAGENLNTWGAPKLNNVLSRIDTAIAGLSVIALTGDHALTSSNGDDEARAALLKFTGGGPFAVTIPSVSKTYLIWNACSAAVTVTTGVGAGVVVDAGARVVVFCDGAQAAELGYAGYGLKGYIDTAVLAATGSLPAVTGNAGKALFCDGVAWAPKAPTVADISDYSPATNARAIAFSLLF